jgi:hypothetical protein
MPTGYTYKVKEGKTSFRDFLLDCSRAFGALVTLRDEPNAPIPEEFLLEPYHKEKLTNARGELKRAESMSLEEAEQEAEREYKLSLREFNRGKKENTQTRKNYESILEQARTWQPPTKDHIGLRDFMVSQLEESIKFDCGGSYYDEPPQKKTGEEYKAGLIESSQRDVAYHGEEYKKEVQRAKERTDWVKALKGSLPKE